MKRFAATGAMTVMLLSATAAFATNYDEGMSGDLSSDRLNPTDITLTLGSNLITATSANANQAPPAGDIDYFTVTVPPGMRLSAININSTTTPSLAWLAVQAGTTFTEPNQGTNPANLLGYTHFGATSGDILDNLPFGISGFPPPIGFTPPLPAGNYTFWYQETSSIPTTTTFNFVVAALPVPVPRVAIAALGLGLLLVACRFVMRKRAG